MTHDRANYFMQEALKEAQIALGLGEIPVGCVIVCRDRIIARGHNSTEQLQDATAHAEMIAITSATAHLGSKYLSDCQMYVTLEPCVMCAGAIKWSQLGNLVYGASDDKNGFMKYGKSLLHPKTSLELGILQQACSAILNSFFLKKRSRRTL